MPIIEHWNGPKWSIVAGHAPGGGTYLQGVTAISAHDAWAVSYTNPNTCDPDCGATILHWNGTYWSVAATPNRPSGYLNLLGGVVATSKRNAWAVGTTDWQPTLIDHWNGTSRSD